MCISCTSLKFRETSIQKMLFVILFVKTLCNVIQCKGMKQYVPDQNFLYYLAIFFVFYVSLSSPPAFLQLSSFFRVNLMNVSPIFKVFMKKFLQTFLGLVSHEISNVASFTTFNSPSTRISGMHFFCVLL